MRRAALVAVLIGIGIFCFDHPAAWARGFGGAEAAGAEAFAVAEVSATFRRASHSGGGYRAPSDVAPRETYHAAPAYHPGPVAHYESPTSNRFTGFEKRAANADRASVIYRRSRGHRTSRQCGRSPSQCESRRQQPLGPLARPWLGQRLVPRQLARELGQLLAHRIGPTGGPIPGTPGRPFGA